MMFELTITNIIANELTFSHIIGTMQPQPAPVTPDIPGNGTETIRVRLKKNQNATSDAVEIFYKRDEPGGPRWYSIHIDRNLGTISVVRKFAHGPNGLNLPVGQLPSHSQGFSAYTTASNANGPIKKAIVQAMIHHGKSKYSFII